MKRSVHRRGRLPLSDEKIGQLQNVAMYFIGTMETAVVPIRWTPPATSMSTTIDHPVKHSSSQSQQHSPTPNVFESESYAHVFYPVHCLFLSLVLFTRARDPIFRYHIFRHANDQMSPAVGISAIPGRCRYEQKQRPDTALVSDHADTQSSGQGGRICCPR